MISQATLNTALPKFCEQFKPKVSELFKVDKSRLLFGLAVHRRFYMSSGI